MSDYTVVSFELRSPERVAAIRKYALELFDAIGLKDLQVKGRFCYQLTIHELGLREALPILDDLQKKFKLVFVVDYGVY